MSRDYLYRSVFRGVQESSPQFGGSCGDMSPMSSLSNILFEASLTPCKRLSLSSSISDTPQSIHNISSLAGMSDSFTYNNDKSMNSCEKYVHSPRRLSSPVNKENIPTPYYSPSHGLIARHRISPLSEVQNTVNRNLSFSPLKKPVSPSKREHLSPVKNPSPTGDCDSNSRDSGYSESGQKKDGFNVPRLCAPTRRLNLDMSPCYSGCKSPKEAGKLRSFASLSKKSNEDALLMEFICGDSDETEEEHSSSFSSLLSAPIHSSMSSSNPQSSCGRLPIRRCLSMIDNVTPLSSRLKSIEEAKALTPIQKMELVPSPVSCCNASFKRPMQARSPCPTEPKRRKANDSESPDLKIKSANLPTKEASKQLLSTRQLSNPETGPVVAVRPKIQRCHSESHVSIMRALNNSSNHNGELTGDFTQQLALPLVQGAKHPDLKSVSVHTIADLIRGNFKDKVDSFKIIDCRYPYEFEGGHILDASNWHHPQMVLDHIYALDSPPKIQTENSSRNILIFHCEFSAERGPKAQRLLRENDRTINKEHYPALHFPELYLLEGGYKAFFESYPELCVPKDYVKMLDENHSEDLKFFRSKSKSWASEAKQSKGKNPIFRPGHKRLGL